MRWNDDIIGKKIDNVMRTGATVTICLSNGMRIKVDRTQMVDDAGVDFPIGHWANIRDGKRVRIPPPKPVRKDQEVENANRE